MKIVLCAGVFALATIGLLSNGSQAVAMEVTGAYGAQASASINIARIKSVLKFDSGAGTPLGSGRSSIA